MTNQLLAELEMLQQTKDKLQNDYQNAVDKLNELQQENKQLKKHHISVRPYTNDEVREKIDNYRDIIKQLFKTLIDKQKRIDKANEILSKSCFEYDNCPDNVINEIIELKEILGDKE